MPKKPDGVTWEEWCEDLIRKNQAMSQAIDLSNTQFNQITEHVEALMATNKSLTAQLEASRISNGALATQINSAGKSDREEVMRLRKLCQASGVDPNG